MHMILSLASRQPSFPHNLCGWWYLQAVSSRDLSVLVQFGVNALIPTWFRCVMEFAWISLSTVLTVSPLQTKTVKTVEVAGRSS